MTTIFAKNTSFYQFFFFWFITALLVHLFVKKYILKPKDSSSNLPPTPPALPLIGHLHLISSVPATSFHSLSRRYGPLIQLRMGASTFVVASNTVVAKEIFKTNEHNFLSRPELGASELFIYKGSKFIMAPYGDYWRFMKKLTMTKLLSTAQLDLFADIRHDEVTKLVERIGMNSTEGKASDLCFESTTLTNNIICRMALDTVCSGNENEAEEIKDLICTINKLAGKVAIGDILGPFKVFDFSGFGKKFGEYLKRFDKLAEKIMKEHEEKAMNDEVDKRKDLLDILLEIYTDPTAEIKLTRKDIKSFLLDMFMAGTDTTSAAIQWAMGELLNKQESFQKLREEIISVVGDKRLVKESDIPNLPYLRAVCKETLRLHPSAPLIIRECFKDCKINDLLLKEKTRVLINVYAVMRDPDSWLDPDKFKPERFLEGSTERIGDHQMEIKGQNFRFIPFGSGKRGCIGASLAMLVMQCAVAALVQSFDWKTKNGNEEAVDLSPGPGFVIEMAKPIIRYAHPISESC